MLNTSWKGPGEGRRPSPRWAWAIPGGRLCYIQKTRCLAATISDGLNLSGCGCGEETWILDRMTWSHILVPVLNYVIFPFQVLVSFSSGKQATLFEHIGLLWDHKGDDTHNRFPKVLARSKFLIDISFYYSVHRRDELPTHDRGGEKQTHKPGCE